MNKILILICCTLLCSTANFAQVGIGTTNPLSTLDVNGNLSVKHMVLTGSATPTIIGDGVYLSINPIVQDQEFVLPDPTVFPGRVYIIRNINNSVTAKLTTAAGLLFSKDSTIGSSEVYMYENHSRTMLVISDGVNWTYID